MKAFERKNPGHLLTSQQIDLHNAVDWLIEKRESANYRDVRFAEPDFGEGLKYSIERGCRAVVNEYLSESSALYVFDPDHALLAFPLRTLQLIGDQLKGPGLTNSSESEQDFIRSRAKDQKGNPLPLLIGELKRLAVLE